MKFQYISNIHFLYLTKMLNRMFDRYQVDIQAWVKLYIVPRKLSTCCVNSHYVLDWWSISCCVNIRWMANLPRLGQRINNPLARHCNNFF